MTFADGAGESARVAMLGTLAERLAAEKQLLQDAHARHQELVGLLEQQKAAYPQVTLREETLPVDCVYKRSICLFC